MRAILARVLLMMGAVALATTACGTPSEPGGGAAQPQEATSQQPAGRTPNTPQATEAPAGAVAQATLKPTLGQPAKVPAPTEPPAPTTAPAVAVSEPLCPTPTPGGDIPTVEPGPDAGGETGQAVGGSPDTSGSSGGGTAPDLATRVAILNRVNRGGPPRPGNDPTNPPATPVPGSEAHLPGDDASRPPTPTPCR